MGSQKTQLRACSQTPLARQLHQTMLLLVIAGAALAAADIISITGGPTDDENEERAQKRGAVPRYTNWTCYYLWCDNSNYFSHFNNNKGYWYQYPLKVGRYFGRLVDNGLNSALSYHGGYITNNKGMHFNHQH